MKQEQVTLTLAVIGSTLGLYGAIMSTLNYRRDREKLTSQMLYRPAWKDKEDGISFPSRIEVEAVNSGRRIIILRWLCAAYKGGKWWRRNWKKTSLDTNGVSLSEKQPFTYDQRELNHMLLDDECNAAIDMWFEDTLGKKHKIKNAQKCLKSYFKRDEPPRPDEDKIVPTPPKPTPGVWTSDQIKALPPKRIDPNDPVDLSSYD